MKKTKLLICGLLIGAVFASTPEDGNPFSKASTLNSVKYEPLEVEMVDVTADQPSKPTSHTPWYKNKRFWYGAAVVTGVVATTAAVTYAIVKATSGEDSHHDVPNMPSVSPIPSFINNITESVTSSLSRSWSNIASHSPFPSPTASPSWSQSLSNSWSAITSRSASWSSSWSSSLSESWSESLSSTFSSSMSALESLTSSVTATFSPVHARSSHITNYYTVTPTPFPSPGTTYHTWNAVCEFTRFRTPTGYDRKADCYNGTYTPGCVTTTPYSTAHGCSDNQIVIDQILRRAWLCYPTPIPNGIVKWNYKNFHCIPQ